jgi:hypothetical protein
MNNAAKNSLGKYALCVCLSVPLAAIPIAGVAQAQPQSSAIGLDANFVVAGTATEFGPIDALQGNATGAYNNSVKVGSVNGTMPLYPSNPAPTLFVDAQGFLSHVSASGVDNGSRSSESDTHVNSTSLVLNLNPPPPSGLTSEPLIPAPFLSVTSGSIKSQTSFSQVSPNAKSAEGSAQIASLSIWGSAVGNNTLKFSGNAAPNTVIYETPTVTITLNKQVRQVIISCSPPKCSFIVAGMTTDAIDINLNKADWYGRKVSGDIVIGETHAQ